MADSKTFRANMLERQEKGLIPATERETRMEVRAWVGQSVGGWVSYVEI